ncbi:MAG TPA: preprotein translocase subunit YajC [Candidatus Azosocius sp. HAIN]
MILKFLIYFIFLFYPYNASFAEIDKISVNNESFLPIFFICFIVFLYFYIIRPQSKKEKVLKTIRDNLVKGDEVIISNGILSTIVNVKDQWVIVSISENCEIIIQKNSIIQEVPKGTIKHMLGK